MKNNLSFNITSLLYGDELRGPIRQVQFAQYFAAQRFHLNLLARVDFEKKEIHSFSSSSKAEETLLIGYQAGEIKEMHMVIMSDGGKSITVATGYQSSGDIYIDEQYITAVMEQKLTDKEICEIFVTIWDDPTLVHPRYFEIPGD